MSTQLQCSTWHGHCSCTELSNFVSGYQDFYLCVIFYSLVWGLSSQAVSNYCCFSTTSPIHDYVVWVAISEYNQSQHCSWIIFLKFYSISLQIFLFDEVSWHKHFRFAWALLEEFSSLMLEDCSALPFEFTLFCYLPVNSYAKEGIWQIDKLIIGWLFWIL